MCVLRADSLAVGERSALGYAALTIIRDPQACEAHAIHVFTGAVTVFAGSTALGADPDTTISVEGGDIANTVHTFGGGFGSAWNTMYMPRRIADGLIRRAGKL